MRKKNCGPALRRATVGPVAEKTIELDRLEKIEVVTRFITERTLYALCSCRRTAYNVQQTDQPAHEAASAGSLLPFWRRGTCPSRSLARSLPRGGSSWVARFKGIVVDDGRPVASPLGAFSSSLVHTIVIATPGLSRRICCCSPLYPCSPG